jgi:HAD superfamily hydrolase (TIGR01509 family)
VLKQLHGKYLMGVVTSSHREPFELIHRSTGFMEYFAFALTGEDYTKYKPDPEPYLLAIEKTGFSVDECIAIEDSWRGLTAAISAGLRCIVVPRGFTLTGRFDGAYTVLKDVRELPDVIQAMEAAVRT